MDPSALETDPSEARTAIFGQRVGTEVQPQNEMWAGSKVHHLTGHDPIWSVLDVCNLFASEASTEARLLFARAPGPAPWRRPGEFVRESGRGSTASCPDQGH